MNTKLKTSLITLVITAIALPSLGQAATFYYGGWMPYWKKISGTQDTSLHIEKLNEVSPFSYEVKPDGTLVDKLKITSDPFWIPWFAAIRDLKIKNIPTIAWFYGDEIHALLSNSKKRVAHENAILKLVKDNKFDGIDIDYEGKLSDTKDYFSTFIYGLAIRLHPIGKKLACTIEPRSPDENLIVKGHSLEEINQRANDYAILNKYCDEVRLMAYDQGTIDPFLNAAKGLSVPYAPVADPVWVDKVIRTTISGGISKSKLMLGVPTYGYEYVVSKDIYGNFVYTRSRSWTYEQAILLAAALGVTPERTSSGELAFTYPQNMSQNTVSSLAQLFSLTLSVNAFNQSATSTRIVWFSDAQAAVDKINLAKKYGLRGVYFFKFDGDVDPALWGKLK
ncbi:MAG: glycosyl hydrolase family 18 protein [Candidatus Wolfebacteria bacterium]|nr:glycosyl hydrolase family 18 protein [Candidatus Wolfebacteria bacterium]